MNNDEFLENLLISIVRVRRCTLALEKLCSAKDNLLFSVDLENEAYNRYKNHVKELIESSIRLIEDK